ncbi:DUF7282 domain-containing protein [Halorussus ruber]|uniref:DUF7282 domain-containing protein n=1 Tax=Halorussus ruber TaxID=1126238 RepID=UPI001B2FF37C|nr:hypothetical protein [Halorussus ruber]
MGVQETTTAAEDDNETASVTINEQETDGEQVVVESVTMPEGGFIAIHDSSVAEAPIASVLGNSVYLEPGTHENVTITLARPITEDQTLVAMPHFDTNDNEVYDFVLSTGELDGPYTADGSVVVDQANVTVTQETTTTTEEAEETTTEGVEETTTEEVVDETTTAAPGETTTEAEEPPAGMEQFIFKVEEMSIDRWSFVVGDEETPDRTETVRNINVQDRRVVINLAEVLRQAEASQGQMGQMTTQSPEQVEEQLEENITQDIQTVRFVIENVNVENVTFVILAPEDVDLPQPPMMTTTEAPEETTTEEVVEETTTEEVVEETTTAAPEETTTAAPEETTTEEVVEETTTEEVVEETTATPEETTTEEVVEETTTEEVVEETTTEEVVEETTTEEVVEETTTEEVVEETTTEEVVEETTTEEVEETTTEEVEETTTEAVEETTTTEETIGAVDLNSFEVSQLDAPESATAGDTITVSATVSNPNDQEATQTVAFRLEGTVIARETVTLDAGEQTNVSFEVDTEGVPAGQYIHGVYTRDFGELAVIVLEEPGAETTTAAAGETTAAAGNETTTAEA